MQQWARSIGDGLPSDTWEDGRTASRISPLNDDLATLIDRIVLGAPTHLRMFFKWWYKTTMPVNEIAARMGVSREETIRRWVAALEWIRPKLIGEEP
jgi:hypothetical protein